MLNDFPGIYRRTECQLDCGCTFAIKWLKMDWEGSAADIQISITYSSNLGSYHFKTIPMWFTFRELRRFSEFLQRYSIGGEFDDDFEFEEDIYVPQYLDFEMTLFRAIA